MTDLGAFLDEALDGPSTGVAVGTFGALAEYLPDGPVVRGSAGLVATVPGGGVRIVDVDGLGARAWRRPTGSRPRWTHAVAVCLPIERAAGAGRTVVTELGPDRDAIDDTDRAAVLIDLGLGVAHLEACVRTTDPGLLSTLRAAEGRALDAELSAALVAAGPVRVFRTLAARVEVRTPIPPPTGASPPGPHTHLLPALLAHRRTHAATDPVPEGHVAVATVFPAHPQQDALGREHPFDAAADAAFDAVMHVFGDPAEVTTTDEVTAAITADEPARTPPPGLSWAARRGWEIALRRLEAAGTTTATWAAWRAASRPASDDEAPFHEQH